MVCFLIIIVIAVIILWQYFHQEPLPNNTVVGFVGTMGSGKTFLSVREAKKEYKKVKLTHIFCKYLVIPRFFFPKWRRRPYLFSNIPIKISHFGKRKYCNVLKREHILREELLPEGAITNIDEIGQVASQWEYENPYVREQLADFTRFYRHWIDGRMFVTDQSSDNIVKVVRCRLGIIYHLNNFHRWLKLLPFFKVECIPLLMVEDSQKETSNVDFGAKQYFFGMLHYRWAEKLFKLKSYDSRCYSEIYRHGATTTPTAYDSTLKTRYLIDISVSRDVSKAYKADRQAFKQALYSPAAFMRSEGVQGEAAGSPAHSDREAAS